MQPPISGSTRLAAVIGTPVAHSLSPALHNAAFESAGLDWRFVAFDVAAGGAADAIRAMRTLGIGGLAVTMPHKAEAALAVDAVDAAAAALSSVNTVVLRPDGTTFGASTDGAGFVNWVGECGVELSEARVVVIGAGAAGRSIVDALGRAGVAGVTIVNRTAATAESAADLADVARVGSIDDAGDATLLVNTTSVGMGTDAVPFDTSVLHPDVVVADIVYHPLETALLAAARRAGAQAIDGLGMLVHQAVLQQELWTGHRPDPAVLRSAAEAELTNRSG
jgi:shikimate dehydrogenase